MKKSDFYYDLPEELIAQHPLEQRDSSRLLHVDLNTGELEHRHFTDILDYLRPGDCLILNDTRVLPARIYGVKEGTGAVVEFLLLKQVDLDTWECLTKPGKRAKEGTTFAFGAEDEGGEPLMMGDVIEVKDDGNRVVHFRYDASTDGTVTDDSTTSGANFYAILDRIGQMPLPPYIKEKLEDQERYQTVYARELGSAAAPTAGLHFTPELLQKVQDMGVKIGRVTLHVGLGTFRPVKEDNIEDHLMHSEHYWMPAETAALINETKSQGGRVICVGTTSCRTVESVGTKLRTKAEELRALNAENTDSDKQTNPQTALDDNFFGVKPDGRKFLKMQEDEDWTSIFIYPGYEFTCMDALITNFHLPESTLIMLVSAFAGRDTTLHAYEVAVQERYRFFSFGDAMMLS